MSSRIAPEMARFRGALGPRWFRAEPALRRNREQQRPGLIGFAQNLAICAALVLARIHSAGIWGITFEERTSGRFVEILGEAGFINCDGGVCTLDDIDLISGLVVVSQVAGQKVG